MDPIVLLERARDAPLESLLGKLRDIHHQRSLEPSWLPAADVLSRLEPSPPRAPDAGSPRAPSAGGELLPGVVELLRRIEQGKRSARAEPARAAASGAEAGSASYDEIRELFRAHEGELARRASLTERVLDQLRRGEGVERILPPAPLQQELRLACPVGGASAGRFVVANETAAGHEVHFEVGPLRGAAEGVGERLGVSFTPATLRIAPQETRVVRLGIDLAGVPLQSGERLELPVDIRAAGDSLGRLWVEIVVVDADEPEVGR